MISRVVKCLVGLGFCLALGGSCGGSATTTEGSESHFLDACMPGSCGDGLSCICGVCTRACSGSECSTLSAGAECVELTDLPNADGCTDVSPAQPVCDQPCVADADCTTLGTSFGCREGVCRSTTPPAPLPEAGPVPDMFACEVSSDCMVASPGCCGVCEPIAMSDLVAIRRDRGPAYRAATCPPPEPTCGACPEVTDEQMLLANYAASCVAGAAKYSTFAPPTTRIVRTARPAS